MKYINITCVIVYFSKRVRGFSPKLISWRCELIDCFKYSAATNE